jgi:NitT/TauT family transport system ATP-binding protein
MSTSQIHSQAALVTDAGPVPIVEVRGVTKTYQGGVEALSGIPLDFPEGKLTTLLGPSGCGKTTLLKIIAGLIPASGGKVLVDGREVTGPGPERAFVFQDFALMPWASVIQNVAFGLELRGVARSEREAIAVRHIERVGLKGFEQKFPHELSGGMRQRVGLARALAVNAKVVLMDEPFSAVDEQTRRKFQEELLDLVANERKTFIFVTHSIEEAVYVSDRIVLLSRRPSRVTSIIEPKVVRGGDPEKNRRDSAYLDVVEDIWQQLKHYLDWGVAMVIAGYRLPMMSALIVWAILWELAGHTEISFILPPLSRIVTRIAEIVPTPSFLEAILITGRGFLAGNMIAIVVGIPPRHPDGTLDYCRSAAPAVGQPVPVSTSQCARAGNHGAVRARRNHNRAHGRALRDVDHRSEHPRRRAGDYTIAGRNGTQLRRE